jgi:hypothetical protein
MRPTAGRSPGRRLASARVKLPSWEVHAMLQPELAAESRATKTPPFS